MALLGLAIVGLGVWAMLNRLARAVEEVVEAVDRVAREISRLE